MDLWKSKRKIVMVTAMLLLFMLLCTLISKSVYAYSLPQVTVEEAKKKTLGRLIRVSGAVSQSREYAVSTLPSIRVESVEVGKGDEVSEGTVLFTLDRQDLEEQIAQQELVVKRLEVQIATLQYNQGLAGEEKVRDTNRLLEDYVDAAAENDIAIGRAAVKEEEARQDLQKHLEDVPKITDEEGRKAAWKEYEDWKERGKALQEEVERLTKELSKAQKTVEEAQAALDAAGQEGQYAGAEFSLEQVREADGDGAERAASLEDIRTDGGSVSLEESGTGGNSALSAEPGADESAASLEESGVDGGTALSADLGADGGSVSLEDFEAAVGAASGEIFDAAESAVLAESSDTVEDSASSADPGTDGGSVAPEESETDGGSASPEEPGTDGGSESSEDPGTDGSSASSTDPGANSGSGTPEDPGTDSGLDVPEDSSGQELSALQKRLEEATAKRDACAAELEKAQEKWQEYQSEMKAEPDFTAEDAEKKSWESQSEALKRNVESADWAHEDALRQKERALEEAQRKVDDAAAPEELQDALALAQLELSWQKEVLEGYYRLQGQDGKITASQKGVVTAVNVSAGNDTPDGAAVAYADREENLEFRMMLTKEEKKFINQGTMGKLQLGNEQESCPVEYLEAQPDGSYLAIVSLPEGMGSIGQSGTFVVTWQSESYSRCIPLNAIQEENQRKFIYVVRRQQGILGEELAAEKRFVTVQEEGDSYAALDPSDLEDGEEVIVASTKALADGDVVRYRLSDAGA